MTMAGSSGPTRWVPMVKESLPGQATATTRPRSSRTGTRVTPSRKSQSISSMRVPSVTDRGEWLATVEAGTSRSVWPAAR